MKERTNIQIERPTLLRMKIFKITKLETYNEILIRLMDEYEKNLQI